MNFKKTTAKVLSMVMCLALLFTVCAPAVSAVEPKKELNYVSIGDSMTNGYGFKDYNQDLNGWDFFKGEIKYGQGAYPLQFEAWLESPEGGNYDVNHTKLAVSGLKAEDVLFLLGGVDELPEDHWNGFIDYLGVDNSQVDEAFLEKVQEVYQEAVTEADVITLCLGNASFGAYLMDKIVDIFDVFNADGYDYDDLTIETALELVESEKIKEMVREICADLKDEIMPYVSVIGADKAEDIVNVTTYTVASFLASYDAVIDRIVEMNPNVDVVLVGLMNTLKGVNVTGEGYSIPVGEIMQNMFGVLNTYIAGLPAMKKATGELNYADADFYYAAQPNPEYIVDAFADFVYGGWAEDAYFDGRISGDTLLRKTLNSYNGDILPMIAGIVADMFGEDYGTTYNAMRLDPAYVKAYQPALNIGQAVQALVDVNGTFADFGMELEDIIIDNAGDKKSLSCAIYLGLERAIADSAKIDDIPLTSLMKMMDLPSVFTDLEVPDVASLFPNMNTGDMGSVIKFVNENKAVLDGLKADVEAKGAALTAAIINGGDVDAATVALNDAKAAYEAAKAEVQEEWATFADYSIEEYFYNFFASEEVLPLCKIYGIFKVGDGMSVHPSPVGHDKIADSVINAYANKHTVFAETLNNGQIIAEFIFENYKEIYAFVYDYADKIGLVDDITANVDTYLNNTLAALEAAEKLAKEYSLSDEFTAQAIATVASARTTIEAIRTLIKNADELDDETLANAVALIATLENTLVDLANLINIAVEDGVVYATPYVQEALAYLNVKVNEALVALEELNAKCQAYAAKAKEIIAYLLSAGENYVKDFLSNSAFDANYTVSKDSYILAIGSDTAYAALLAEKLGLGKNQFGTMAWDNLDSSIIAKADLITVGYDTAKFASFTIDQVVAYVTDYVNVDLRKDANAYVEAAIKHLFAEVPFVNTKFVEGIIADVKAELNTTIDEILGNEMIPEATATDFDWAALVGEENVAKIESMIDSIVAEIEATGALDAVINEIEGVEDGKIKIEVAKLFLESVDEDVLAIINAEDVEALFGDYANYEIELPVYEVVALAIESYFYSYIQFNIEYAQTVYAINVINPDAKVVLLSGYNAFDGNGFDLVIGDIVIDLDTILTPELKDVAESFIDDAYTAIFDTVDSAIDVENVVIIEKVLEAFENYVDLAIAEIKNVQGEIAAIDVVEIIKNFEIPEIELAAIVGEENVAYAQRLINVVKFALTESDIYDAVMAEIPVAEDIQNVLLALYAKLAAGVEGLDDLAAIGEEKLADLFVELELSIPAVRDMLADLAVYVEVIKEYSVDLKAILGDLYDKVAAETITIKGTSIDLGDIFGDVVPGTTSIHSLVYAFSMKNVIFVDVSEVETLGDELSMVEYILTYIYDRTITGATEAGLAYIAEQIYNALNVTCDHVDYDKDHACDFCGMEMGEHVDADKDHFCDYGCSEKIGEHADADKDHKCDYGCSEKIGDHADADKDHKCDYCQAEMTKHVDENKDHKCDNGCSVAIGDHVDADKDHKCDYGCSEAIGDHADADKDHNCDYGCSEKIGSHTEDANKDHNCDYCGAKISECTWGEWVVTTEATKRHDGEEQRTCSYCGAVETRVIPEIPGLTAIAVVGIVLGSAVVVGGIGFAVYFFVFKKKVFAK